MRARFWVSVVATIGVLVHAVALAHHNVAMAGARALAADLAQICHGGGGGPGVPAAPDPFDSQVICPICSGIGSTFADLPEIFIGDIPPAPGPVLLDLAPRPVACSEPTLRPPVRAPPGAAI